MFLPLLLTEMQLSGPEGIREVYSFVPFTKLLCGELLTKKKPFFLFPSDDQDAYAICYIRATCVSGSNLIDYIILYGEMATDKVGSHAATPVAPSHTLNGIYEHADT